MERRHDGPLDPAADPARWERMVHAIRADAAPELRRRAQRRRPTQLLTHWARPVLAAAASIAVAALGVLWTADGDSRPVLVSEAVVPTTVAAWLETGRTPSLEELVTIDGAQR